MSKPSIRTPQQAVRKESPTAEQVKAARNACKQTTVSAANTVYITLRQWQKYEAGAASMPPAVFELYMIKTGQMVINVEPIVAKVV